MSAVARGGRWLRLKAQMIEKRSKLGESQTLQQFSRDVDEIEAWISEKLQTAMDESYKDPTNIQVRHPEYPAGLFPSFFKICASIISPFLFIY